MNKAKAARASGLLKGTVVVSQGRKTGHPTAQYNMGAMRHY
jgi:hypothetical protein